MPIHHNVDPMVLLILKKIFIETMQIVVAFNNEKSRKVNKCGSRNNLSYLDLNDDKLNTDTNSDDSGTSEYYDYHKFNLQELIRTHFEFVIVNRKQLFDIDEIKQLLSISHFMSGMQKYSFLKIILSFHNDVIENVQNNPMKLQREQRDEYVLSWRSLIKYSISSKVDYQSM